MPVIETTIHVDAAPAAVWDVISDFGAFEQWNPMVVAADGRAEVGARLTIQVVLSKGRAPQRARSTVLVCDPEREVRWGGGFRPLLWVEHWVRIASDGPGTRVEHGESFAGLLARPGLWLLGLTAAPYEAMNEALKRRVEAV